MAVQYGYGTPVGTGRQSSSSATSIRSGMGGLKTGETPVTPPPSKGMGQGILDLYAQQAASQKAAYEAMLAEQQRLHQLMLEQQQIGQEDFAQQMAMLSSTPVAPRNKMSFLYGY